MTAYLLDTNHVSALLDGVVAIRERIEAADPGDLFGIAVPILGELYFRAYASQRRRKPGPIGGFFDPRAGLGVRDCGSTRVCGFRLNKSAKGSQSQP
jgi:hypothetical protein